MLSRNQIPQSGQDTHFYTSPYSKVIISDSARGWAQQENQSVSEQCYAWTAPTVGSSFKFISLRTYGLLIGYGQKLPPEGHVLQILVK